MTGKSRKKPTRTGYVKTTAKKTTVNLRTKTGKVLKVKATRTSATTPKRKTSSSSSKCRLRRKGKGS